MKRRDFLKSLVVLAAAPAIVKAENIMKIYVPKIITSPWGFNSITQELYYTGAKSAQYSVLDLYRFLQNELDKPENITIAAPMRLTDHYIDLGKDIILDTSAYPHINSGSIKSGQDILSYVTTNYDIC